MIHPCMHSFRRYFFPTNSTLQVFNSVQKLIANVPNLHDGEQDLCAFQSSNLQVSCVGMDHDPIAIDIVTKGAPVAGSMTLLPGSSLSFSELADVDLRSYVDVVATVIPIQEGW